MLSEVTSVLNYTLEICRLYHTEHTQHGLATTIKAPFLSSRNGDTTSCTQECSKNAILSNSSIH